MIDKGTDPPALETPSPVWPPAPQAASPTTEPDRTKNGTQFSTLTPYAWLDLVLGLPAGFVGTFLLFAAVGLIGDLVSPPPESDIKLRFEFCVSAALSTAACFVIGRRAPLFGIALTTGALIVLMIAALIVWLAMPWSR